MHHASAQQVTQNTVKGNVLQNRSIFQLGNTRSYQVIAYMGIISALKILSDLQRHISHLCEHGYGHNFIKHSNALMQLLPAPPVPPGDLSSHIPPFTPFNLILKGTQQQSSRVTPSETPAWINHSHQRGRAVITIKAGAGQPVPFFHSCQDNSSAQE